MESLYDALGRRAEKKIIENNQETIRRFAYLNNEVIAELDGDNEVLVKYTHSGLRTDDVLEMEVTTAGHQAGIAAQGAYYFAKDGLGSIVDIHNSAGAVVQHYVYSSFGKILKITNSGVDNTADPLIKNRFTYTNREFDDESGLYYYRARYYDAHSGRFMQEDPHPGMQRSPITFSNKYIYGNNSSPNYKDPDGKLALLTVILIGAVVGALLNVGNALNSTDENGKKRSFSFGQLIGTALVGAFTGAATAALGGLAGASMLLAIPGSAVLAGLNNALNQLIFTGAVRDMGSLGAAAVGGAIGGAAGLGMIGANSWATEAGNRALSFIVGGLYGMAVPNGIPGDDTRYRCQTVNCSEINWGN